MKKDYTYIGCVLDRSGSMGQDSKILEAMNGFNVFVEEQKKLDGKADIKVVVFDDKIEDVYTGDINEAVVLNNDNFYPRGMTAYYDALGKTVSEIGESLRLMKEEDRPEKVIILVITDGLENSSHEYTANYIKDMIQTQKNDYNWEFIFMGADESAINEAKGFGIVNSVLYSNTLVGTRNAYTAMSNATTAYRTTGKVNLPDDLNEDE